MAMSNEDLAALKVRVIAASGTGAQVARANDYLLELIAEVESLRKGSSKAEPLPKGIKKVVVVETVVEPVAVEPTPVVEDAPPVVEEPKAETPVVASSSKDDDAHEEKGHHKPKGKGKK